MSTVALDRSERLDTLFAPVRDMSSLMGAVVIGSIVFHAILVATAFVSGRAPIETPKEIAIEIVQEVPKPPEPKPEPPKPAPKAEPAKAERAMPEPPKPAPKPVAAAKPPEAPKPAPVAKAEPPKAAPSKPSASDSALQKELESLRAEQAALQNQLTRSSAEAEALKAQMPSGKAVALASADEAGGDPVGYQQLVFSQLAKAKDETAFRGGIGSTAVRFEIATNGALAGVEVVTPSGDKDLDKEAIAIVQRAAPFPPPPKDAERVVFANVNFVPPKHR